jgi:hypothetical protein
MFVYQRVSSHICLTTPQLLREITKQNTGSEIPEGRALMTSNIAYAHLVGKIPFIAHDGCKDPDLNSNSCPELTRQRKLNFLMIFLQKIDVLLT